MHHEGTSLRSRLKLAHNVAELVEIYVKIAMDEVSRSSSNVSFAFLKGRINYTTLHILPEGVSPQWCRSCRGSGLWYCEKCEPYTLEI